VRPDMGEGCPERIDLEFLKWVWNFNPKNRKRYHRLLAEQQDKKIYIFKNRRQTRKFLQKQMFMTMPFCKTVLGSKHF
jgi:hypothetical protein